MLRTIETLNQPDLMPIKDASAVSGFQSPANDYEEDRLNILQKLIKDPLNTYYFECDSEEMRHFGIHEKTLLIVDRTVTPKGGNLVIAWSAGEWLVRQLLDIKGVKSLTTGARGETPLLIQDEGILLWGVVTWSCSPQIENHVCTSRL